MPIYMQDFSISFQASLWNFSSAMIIMSDAFQIEIELTAVADDITCTYY